MTAPEPGEGVRSARASASAAARLVGASAIEPAHLMIGLCEVCDSDDPKPGEDGAGPPPEDVARLRNCFADAQVDPLALRRRIRKRLGVRGRPDPAGQPVEPGPDVRRVFERAGRLAGRARAGQVSVLHLLRATLEEPVPDWAVPAARLGVDDLLSACFPPVKAGIPPPPPMVELEVRTGSLAGQRWTATEPARWVIGRSEADCNIVVPEDDDRLVSRCHALVEVDPPAARVCDLGSRNGTWVNDLRVEASTDERDRDRSAHGIAGPHRDVRDGDEIALGRTRIRVMVRAPDRCGNCGVPRAAEDSDTDGRCASCRPVDPDAATERARRRVGSSAPRRPRCPVCVEPIEMPVPGEGGVLDGEPPELCRACRRDPDRIVEMIGRRVDRGEYLPDLFGGYTVLRTVGVGGMGQVYQARDEQSDELVCIKVMLPAPNSPEVAPNFRREADNGRQLRHPNVLRQREHGVWHGVLYLVTDYCGGGDLFTVLDRNGGRLEPEHAVRIAIQALDGLHYAHQADITVLLNDGRRDSARGLVHRDISPGNLLFDGETVKVGDFGLSKSFTHAGLSGVTQTGTAAGKPSYMPRRQINDYKWVGPEVDVWALAACLYFMLTGTTPRNFEGRPIAAQVILYDDPIPIRQRNAALPGPLADVVDRALAENTDEPAFGSALALRAALEAVIRR